MAVPITGQVNVTTSAQRLSTLYNVTAFIIKAPVTNQNSVFIGASGVTASTGHAMDPGDQFAYERNDQNEGPKYGISPGDFWVIGTAPDLVTWLVSP